MARTITRLNGAPPLPGYVQDDHAVDCTCRRCRKTWMEIDDTRHTNGTGHAIFCPRCDASKIDRVRTYRRAA